MLRRVLLTAIISATAIYNALSQSSYDPSYYTYPILDVANLYSASFGEMRANHFHSGVDIKSDGVQGKSVVAAADGYISRVSLSPYGYGLALYVAHPNGTTTVYGHLQRFREDIAEHLENERYRTKQHALNIYPEASKFPVKRGELIAYSGSSGSSSGPHLHFEVRESGQQKPLNLVALGIIKPTDNIRPTIKAVYYVETESIDGVCYPLRINKYPAVQGAAGEYTLSDNRTMWVGREGYFVFEVTDRKSNVSNIFGIYSLEGRMDGELFYQHQQDGFTFANTRYCNAISYYPYQRSTSTEFYRMKRLDGVPSLMLGYTKNGAVIRTSAGDEREIEIAATDDMDNMSRLKFTIRGKDDADCLRATPLDESQIAYHNRATSFTNGALRVDIPKGVLYEPTPFISSDKGAAPTNIPSDVEIYSPIYTIFDLDTPLHSAIDITIKVDIPEAKRAHARIFTMGSSSWASSLGGKYSDGAITASARATGRFFVAVDSTAPELTCSFGEGADLSSASRIYFDFKDNYSGVSSYSATIDGAWIALDLVGSRLTHYFRDKADGESHKLVITITDMCGNSTTKTRKFIR